MHHAKSVLRGAAPNKWSVSQPTPEETAAAAKEAAEGAQFDRLGLKAGVWAAVQRGEARTVCKELRGAGGAGPLARVVCYLPAGVAEPNWDLWARIFAWFGPAADGKPWKVIWFAAVAPRQFPAGGQDLGPEHVNGGYTMPCTTEGIFIYRAEEATRVLVHEMLHAACLDEQGWSIPAREAQIEAWTELFLVALLSRGSVAEAARLWTKQSQWIADVNWKAVQMHGAHDISDYAWRYLTGREAMYGRLGVSLPAANPRVAAGIQSLRFTHPILGE